MTLKQTQEALITSLSNITRYIITCTEAGCKLLQRPVHIQRRRHAVDKCRYQLWQSTHVQCHRVSLCHIRLMSTVTGLNLHYFQFHFWLSRIPSTIITITTIIIIIIIIIICSSSSICVFNQSRCWTLRFTATAVLTYTQFTISK